MFTRCDFRYLLMLFAENRLPTLSAVYAARVSRKSTFLIPSLFTTSFRMMVE